MSGNVTSSAENHTVGNASRTWNLEPFCSWEVLDSTGKGVGMIETTYAAQDVGVCTASYAYTVDLYEVSMDTQDIELWETGNRSFSAETYGTARKALAAAKKFAREFTDPAAEGGEA